MASKQPLNTPTSSEEQYSRGFSLNSLIQAVEQTVRDATGDELSRMDGLYRYYTTTLSEPNSVTFAQLSRLWPEGVGFGDEDEFQQFLHSERRTSMPYLSIGQSMDTDFSGERRTVVFVWDEYLYQPVTWIWEDSKTRLPFCMEDRRMIHGIEYHTYTSEGHLIHAAKSPTKRHIRGPQPSRYFIARYALKDGLFTLDAATFDWNISRPMTMKGLPPHNTRHDRFGLMVRDETYPEFGFCIPDTVQPQEIMLSLVYPDPGKACLSLVDDAAISHYC